MRISGQQSQRHYPLRVLLAILVLTCTGLFPLSAANAQEADETVFRITQVDTSDFPNIRTYLYGENLGMPLQYAPVVLLEDGTAVTTEISQEMVGIQAALVLDAAGNIDDPGMTGEPRFSEAGRAVRRITQGRYLSPDRDWLISISFGENEKPQALRDWSHDHQAVVDALFTYSPVAGIGYTPLADLLRFTILQFDDSELAENQERAIVVFSDGIDVVSTTELTDAINLAVDENIRIHTVMLGPENEDNRRRLERLSVLTNGDYYHLTEIEDLDDLWEKLAGSREQVVLQHRSSQPQPQEISVSVDSGQGLVSDRADVPPLNVRPPEVQIVSPEVDTTIERKAETFASPLADLEPKELLVEVAIVWPNNRSRRIRSMEYDVAGQTIVRSDGQFEDPFAVPIVDLGEGNHTIRVRAVDELGMRAESEPLTIAVKELRPVAPTATPDPSVIARAEEAEALARAAEEQSAEAGQIAEAAKSEAEQAKEQASQWEASFQNAQQMLDRLTWVSIASLLFGLVALGLAIYVLSSRERRHRATEIVTGTVKAVTEPFLRSSRRSAGSAAATAKLVLVDNGGTLSVPTEVPLHRGRVTMGRDPSMVNVPLEDRRVSRYHCRINEEDAGFRIWDEGSTSGTLVNDAEVGHSGWLLQHGDMLEIGPIRYRFERIGKDVESLPSEGETEPRQRHMYDETEVYVRKVDDGQR